MLGLAGEHQDGRCRSLSSATTASNSARLTLSIVSATLAVVIARWRSTCGRSASSRMRSAAGRSWRERSSCTDDCSALKPSNPSLAARRTTVAAPARTPMPDRRRCRRRRWGRSSTAWATRRSAAVSCGPAAAMVGHLELSHPIPAHEPNVTSLRSATHTEGVQLPPPPQRSFASDNAPAPIPTSSPRSSPPTRATPSRMAPTGGPPSAAAVSLSCSAVAKCCSPSPAPAATCSG